MANEVVPNPAYDPNIEGGLDRVQDIPHEPSLTRQNIKMARGIALMAFTTASGSLFSLAGLEYLVKGENTTGAVDLTIAGILFYGSFRLWNKYISTLP